MIIGTIDESQQKAAKVAGFTYLFTVAIVMFANLGIHDRLNVAGNAAATAQNILAHERLFRVGIACDLLYSAGMVVLVTALYVILEPVNRGLALVAAFWRLAYALTWVVMSLNLFNTLRLVKGANYLRVFEPERLQALAKLNIGRNFDVYYAGLLFYGLAATVCGYLWFKSNYVPRVLGASAALASAWCAACTFVLFIFPDFDTLVNLWWFDTPMALVEMATSFWLLFKGLRPPGIAAVEQT